MKNLLIIILIINAFLNICYSQSNIKSKFIDAEFDFLYEEYDKALSKYLYLYNRDSLNANVCYRIGLCYLNLPEKTKAIPFLEKAIQKITDDYREGSYSEINAPVDAFLYLGHAYRIDNRFDKAIESFNKYKINLKVEDVYDIELAEHEIEKCRNAKKYLISPLTVGFKNLKLPINDELNNSWVCITPDEKNLVYTTSKAKDVIFYCEWIGDTRWSAPINISFSIKSTGFFKSVNLSHNGNNLLLYTGDNESGDIYICEKKNNKWQPMKEFPKAINSKYKESGACLSPDGNKLYFSSARPGGSGGFDLYISTFSKGTWSAPVNLGPTINTKYNEDMPYLMPDNITLYFSSEGHDNLGGYDIFYSKKIDEEWSTPLNAGYPISTPGDDIYFKPIKNGEAAYVVKYDTSGYGGLDIFSMTIAPPKKVYTVEMQGLLANNEDSVVYEKKQLFSSDSTIEIQKLIAKADSQNVKEKLSLPVDSAIKITSDSTYLAQTQEKEKHTNELPDKIKLDTLKTQEIAEKITIIEIKGKVTLQDGNDINENIFIKVVSGTTKDTLAVLKPNIPSGAYSFKTIPGNYELIFAGDLYEPNIEYVSVPSTYNLPDIIVNGLLIPKEVSSGEYYIIRNIYFDFNSYEPSREAKIELEKLNKLISENPSLFLEIIGHTDSKGSVQYNKELSIKRARSVFEYLIDIGVDNKLFIGKGVGATESVAFNTNPDGSDNPEGRKYNRRVEIKIYNADSTKVISEDAYIPEHLRIHSSELIYTILLTQRQTQLKEGEYSNFKEYKTDIWYIYTAGSFKRKSEAITFLNNVIEKGFPDAKIITETELKQLIEKSTAFISEKLITEDNKRTKYSVQIKTLRKEIDPTSFTGLQSVEKFKCSDGFFRYIYGDFNTYKEAKEGLVKAIEKGYTDAYIINKDVLKKMEKEEKDILNKEEEIKKQQTLAHKDSISGSIYVLQISTSINLIDTKEFKNIDQSKIIVYKGKDKYYRYTFGEFDGFSAAKIQWNELRQIPEYCDAFIVNKDYYKELSVVTPRK